jgi:aldehyde:ferredoxin oxidoreductase
MAYCFAGKILWVDLSQKQIKKEALDEKICRDYLGGYGLGVRILFDRQKPGVDPLGPDNILGLITGVLTGTPALGGNRYVMVGKSPLTGGWGDANSGGNVGPALKFAGYDAVFFTGQSDKPVYLLIDNGKAEIKDAANIWGKDTFETEDILRAEHGRDLELACIGPSGEKLALIAAVMNNKGRAAGRSGLAAVMGSKKLKAIAMKGKMKVPMADEQKANEMRKRHLSEIPLTAKYTSDYGTAGYFNMDAEADDAPSKNWGGVTPLDFSQYENIGGDPVIAKQERKYGCWHCPIACGGIMKASTGEYKYEAGAHKPEYETLAMFGSNLLNDNLESIIKLNDICNRQGLDTISAGGTIGFVIECYENGILTREDTDGLQMTWGNTKSIVAMTEKMAKREGFGNIIADGTKKAVERIGKGSAKYAMHVGGQEFPAHDPRGGPGYAIGYGAEPTPGRHTMSGEGPPAPPGMMIEPPGFDRNAFKGRGQYHKRGVCIREVYNAAGLCMLAFGDGYAHVDNLVEAMCTITGWDITMDELLKTGERIYNMRLAFNAREGLKVPFDFPDRLMGRPPKTAGPRAGIVLDKDEMFNEYLTAMGVDLEAGKPGKQKLLELGLDDVAKVLWG